MEVSDRLDGRRAVITGASRGIGAATARRLASLGATVFLAARTKDAIAQLADEITQAGGAAIAIPTDVTSEASRQHLMHEVGGELDVLVNNAGILPTAQRLEKLSTADWDEALAMHLIAPWHLSCLAREAMGGDGVIVNMTSTAAYRPSTGLATYAVSKTATMMLTRACALEWAADGIRVVGVAPGMTETEMIAPVVEWAKRTNYEFNPIGRFADPAEIADLIAYIVSDRARYITGCTLAIDGGELISNTAG